MSYQSPSSFLLAFVLFLGIMCLRDATYSKKTVCFLFNICFRIRGALNKFTSHCHKSQVLISKSIKKIRFYAHYSGVKMKISCNNRILEQKTDFVKTIQFNCTNMYFSDSEDSLTSLCLFLQPLYRPFSK